MATASAGSVPRKRFVLLCWNGSSDTGGPFNNGISEMSRELGTTNGFEV